LPAIHAYTYTQTNAHSKSAYDTEAAADSATKAVRGIRDAASLEFLTDRQDDVVEEARFIQTPTLESFTSNFFACCCSLVERNFSSRRAGECHAVPQQSYAGRSSH